MMVVSGLIAPEVDADPGFVSDYLTGFNATAVDLWMFAQIENKMDDYLAVDPNVNYVHYCQINGNNGTNGVFDPSTIGGNRIAVMVGDEPKTQAALDETAQGIAAVKAVDPNAKCIVNMAGSTPGLYANAAQIADILCIDDYHNRPDRLAAARSAAQAVGKPYWCFMSAQGDIDTAGTTANDLWRQAGLYVAYGFQGYRWFVYQITPGYVGGGVEAYATFFETPGDQASLKTSLWDKAAKINKMLVGFGPWLVQAHSSETRFVTASAPWVNYGDVLDVKGMADTPAIVGIFDGGYLSITNDSDTADDFRLKFGGGLTEIRTFNHQGDMETWPLNENGKCFPTIGAGRTLLVKYTPGPWEGLE